MRVGWGTAESRWNRFMSGNADCCGEVGSFGEQYGGPWFCNWRVGFLPTGLAIAPWFLCIRWTVPLAPAP